MTSTKSEASYMAAHTSHSSVHTTTIRSTAGGTSGIPSSLPAVSTIQRLLWLGNIIYYQLLAVLTVEMLWVFFTHAGLKQAILWHMFLATIAYVPLMAVAIIAFSQDNLPTLYITRTKIYVIHGLLLSISFIGVTAGISIMIHHKSSLSHFKSTHGKLGLASWILVFCAVLFGIVAGRTQNYAKYIRPILAKLIHNVLGITAFTLGVASIIVMYQGHHFKPYVSVSANRASYFAAIYIIIWSVLAALKSLFYQVKGVFS